MKIKLFAALILFILFSFVVSTQLTQFASANHHQPMTSPSTGPVTGPVTSPVSMFKISGKVVYHFLGLLRRGADRFMPAAGVEVKAVDIFTHHNVTTMTDDNGNYVLDPGRAGLYKVSVSGGEASFYVPPLHIVPNKKGKDNVNFQGLIFKNNHH